MTKELIATDSRLPVYDSSRIFDRAAPVEIIEYAREAANALVSILDKKPKPVVFNGERYMEYEDWQTVGRFFGLTCLTGDAELVVIDGIKGARAEAKIIVAKTGEVVGSAVSYCMRDEKSWASKPIFQIFSMAQTRAGAKAFRNILSWVPVFAGVSGKILEEFQERPVDHPPAPQVTTSPGFPLTPEQKNTILALCKEDNVAQGDLMTYLKGMWKRYTLSDVVQEEFLPICEWISKKGKEKKGGK